MHSTSRPARYNIDDRRDNDVPAFMTGTLPPKVPEVFDPVYAEACWRVLDVFSPTDLVGSHQYRGADRDKAAGAAFVAHRFPQSPQQERIVVTNGTQGAIVMLLSTLVGRGGVLAVESLSYPPVKVFADMLGIHVLPVDIDDEGIDPDAFDSACRSADVRALYTMPTLHNPTTATMSVERRVAVAEIARRHDVQIIEDDIYGLLPQSAPFALSSYAPERSWYIGGTAKAIAPSLKIAFLVGPNDRATGSRFWPGVRATFWMGSAVNAAVTTELIESGGAARIMDAVRAEIAARQELVASELTDATFRAAPESPHVWLTVPAGRPRAEFVAEVLARGAEIGTSDQFVLGEIPGIPNTVRFGVGGPRTRDAFAAGLAAIVDVHRAMS